MSLTIDDEYRNVIKTRKHALLPSLMVDNGLAAIEFYKNVLDAKLLYLLQYKDKVTHAELMIGDSSIMLADIFQDWGTSNKSGNMAFTLYLYVDDVDQTCQKATINGATVDHPPKDEFYGDRMCSFVDPFGFRWVVAKKVKDISDQEILDGQEKMFNNIQFGSGNNKYYKKYLKYKVKYDKLINN